MFLAEAGASAALLLRVGGGLYWLAPGMAFSLVVAVVNTRPATRSAVRRAGGIAEQGDHDPQQGGSLRRR